MEGGLQFCVLGVDIPRDGVSVGGRILNIWVRMDVVTVPEFPHWKRQCIGDRQPNFIEKMKKKGKSDFNSSILFFGGVDRWKNPVDNSCIDMAGNLSIYRCPLNRPDINILEFPNFLRGSTEVMNSKFFTDFFFTAYFSKNFGVSWVGWSRLQKPYRNCSKNRNDPFYSKPFTPHGTLWAN